MFLDDLFEMAAPTLYHGTNFYSAVQIIQENMFRDKTEHDIPDIGLVKGVSLSRSRKFATDWSFVTFELDRSRLAQRYRLLPFNYWHRGIERTQHDQRQEAEEFIIGPVTDASRYNVAIHISAKSWQHLAKLNGPNDGFYDVLRKHPLLKVHSP